MTRTLALQSIGLITLRMAGDPNGVKNVMDMLRLQGSPRGGIIVANVLASAIDEKLYQDPRDLKVAEDAPPLEDKPNT